MRQYTILDDNIERDSQIPDLVTYFLLLAVRVRLEYQSCKILRRLHYTLRGEHMKNLVTEKNHTRIESQHAQSHVFCREIPRRACSMQRSIY